MGQNLFSVFSHYQVFICLAISYIIGSLPTSYLVGKIFFKTDIRQSGSGNSGATNTLRTFGTGAGLAVLLIDVLKGVAAVLLARYFTRFLTNQLEYNMLISLSGLAAILGHVFSIFLRFKGGKGVATAAGVFLVLLPLPVLFCLVLFAYIVYTTRFVSLGSLLTAVAFLAIELVSQIIMRFPNLPRLFLVILIVAMIFIRHKANIKRLLKGNENKIGFKKETQA